MATYSQLTSPNTTLKLSAAVSGSATRNTTGNSTVYTNSSTTGYALVNVCGIGTGTGTVQVGGQPIFSANTTVSLTGVIIGPSQSLVLAHSTTSGQTYSVYMSGVLLVNSP